MARSAKPANKPDHQRASASARFLLWLSTLDSQLSTTVKPSYLRSLGASNIEKATVQIKKDVRGAIKEGQNGGQNSGDAGGSHCTPAVEAPKKKEYTAAEKATCSIEAMRNGEICEACQ